MSVEVVKHASINVPASAGVYRMIGNADKILYIGKAKNLQNRLDQYTQIKQLSSRIARMIHLVEKVEITTTQTESEALLLEAKLIKEHKPPFNILLKDDKSFPFIAIDENHDFPRIYKHRGKKEKNQSYFGPYSSVMAVNKAISILQKAFLLRPCTDTYFKARKKPCMEYQIKRCSAPCVNIISKQDYFSYVKQAKNFLSGKTDDVKVELQKKMEETSANFQYESAAIYRDRIIALSTIQSSQKIHFNTIDEADVIALMSENSKLCIQVFFVRGGFILGNAEYFPSNIEGLDNSEILEFFISSFYENKPVSKNIILSHSPTNIDIIKQALYEISGKNPEIIVPVRGEKKDALELALSNAKSSIERKFAEEEKSGKIIQKLKEIFNIKREITRIEVFDNSHIFGQNSIGAMIVAGYDEENKWGLLKKYYRKFNVESGEKITGGDDFEMMRQVMKRRYGRIKIEGSKFPELVILDGGLGQLSVALDVFKELGVEKEFDVIAIAKGPDRNAGNEDFYQPNKAPFKLSKNDPVLYFLQNLRDEVHRFAITGHRAKRSKALVSSQLDEIEDIGKIRKKALLNYFGSIALIKSASIEDLCKVEGISQSLAEKIYYHFR
jgi:excinuclease ABC subunit C